MYEEASLDALQSVGLGVDELLVGGVVSSDELVPVEATGVLGLVDS